VDHEASREVFVKS